MKTLVIFAVALVSGCFAQECIQPSTEGYDFSSAGGTLTKEGFAASGITCDIASGYTGTVTSTACGNAGEAYGVVGCTLTDCIKPSTAGYDFSSAGGTLAKEGFAASGITCDIASGYTGTVTSTACTNAGEVYTVGGCALTDCIRPSTPGYDFSSAGGTLTKVGFAASGITCDIASGYTGTVTSTACDNAGEAYGVVGCTLTDCITPSTAGYDFSSAGGTLLPGSFAPSGVVCASGHTGTVAYNVCAAAGDAYSVTGCAAAPATTTEGAIVDGAMSTGFSFVSIMMTLLSVAVVSFVGKV